jgi:hypothetical protein
MQIDICFACRRKWKPKTKGKLEGKEELPGTEEAVPCWSGWGRDSRTEALGGGAAVSNGGERGYCSTLLLCFLSSSFAMFPLLQITTLSLRMGSGPSCPATTPG